MLRLFCPFIIVLGVFNIFGNYVLAGERKLIGQDCLEGAEERVIEGGYKVHRDCWKYSKKYKYEGYSQNNCESLRQEGCVQVDSRCKQHQDHWCVVYEKDFKCEQEEKYKVKETRHRLPTYSNDQKDRRKIRCGEQIICADGKCINQTYEVNNELGETIAMLRTLKEMQKQYSTEPLTVFTGQAEYCKKKAFGFNPCCKLGKKAMVEKLGLSECSAEEKKLAEKKDSGKCEFVGSFKKKQLGVTEYTKYSYCCFDSKLVKEIQVQGRKNQLGRGFGSAKAPECSGLTVEDLQNIDFAKIDFSPVFKEILDSFKSAEWKTEIDRVKTTLETEMARIETSVQDEEADSTYSGTGKPVKLKGENPKYDDSGLL